MISLYTYCLECLVLELSIELYSLALLNAVHECNVKQFADNQFFKVKRHCLSGSGKKFSDFIHASLSITYLNFL
jgi:hypothetical protein